MPVIASHFLVGSIISLLMPVTLLLILWFWYWYSAKRVGDEVDREGRLHTSADRRGPGAVAGPLGGPGAAATEAAGTEPAPRGDS